jgi:hypothetical protein
MTLRELLTRHDAHQINAWWPIAILACHLYNLQTIVINAASGKAKAKPKQPSAFHPYLDSTSVGKRKITPKGISVLKAIGNAMCARR